MQLPNEENYYLFYFGDAPDPYYAVDEIIFDSQNNPYLVDYHGTEPTHWWHLPKPNRGGIK